MLGSRGRASADDFPPWHGELIDLSRFDRIIGSLHTLAIDDDVAEPVTLYRSWQPEHVVRNYMSERERMARQQRTATVITHLDYAIRT